MRITISNGSRVEAKHGQLVSESTNWIIHSDTLSSPSSSGEGQMVGCLGQKFEGGGKTGKRWTNVLPWWPKEVGGE